jgi:hypothetical protein
MRQPCGERDQPANHQSDARTAMVDVSFKATARQ